MKIGEVAKRTGLNISNVRFYERKGLLAPQRAQNSNYREYSEEDVFRIKEILLYRKMGISIETIYLLLNHQAEREEVLSRQKKELEEQLTNLQGAIELCELVLRERSIDKDHIDRYLDYVHQEEKNGKHFSEIRELLDDMNEFTQTGVFYYRPLTSLLIRWPWAERLLVICFWIGIFSLLAAHLMDVYAGKTKLSILLLAMYAVIFVIFGYGFWKFRKSKQRLSEGDGSIQKNDSEQEKETL